MAVPARPVSGAVVESAWGQYVHDAAVAVDTQYGVGTIAGGAGFVALTFPRPFAGAPTFVAVPRYSSGPWCVINPSVTTTGATVYVREVSGSGTNTVPAAAITFDWIAIGPRAG